MFSEIKQHIIAVFDFPSIKYTIKELQLVWVQTNYVRLQFFSAPIQTIYAVLSQKTLPVAFSERYR